MVTNSVAFGVSMRTGEQVWRQPAAAQATGSPLVLAKRFVVIPGHDILVLDVRSGKVHWRARDFSRGVRSPDFSLLAVDGNTVWFTVQDGKARPSAKSRVVRCVDVVERREVWHSFVPSDFTEGHLLNGLVVLTTPGHPDEPSRGAGEFIGLDRSSGTKRWQHGLNGVTRGRIVTTSRGGQLVVADDTRLRAYELSRAGSALWTVHSKGKHESQRPPFGPPLVQGKDVFAADALGGVHRVELSSGRVKWQVDAVDRGSWPSHGPRPKVLVGPGRLLVTATNSGVNAHDVRTGQLLWRFLDVPHPNSGLTGWRKAAVRGGTAVVISQNSAYALPLDGA